MVFQHSRPLHRQTVLENIKLALLPDSLLRLFADPQVDRPRPRDRRRASASAHVHRPASRDPAVRRSAPAGARQSDRARSAGGAGRRALRRTDAGGSRDLLRTDPRLPRRGPRRAAGRPQRQERRGAGRPRASRCISASASPKARADDVMRNETVRRVYLGGAIETAARPESSFKTPTRRCSRSRTSACSTARRRRWRTSSIHVHEGEFVSVVGLNGAGKTTLFNAISGLVPHSGAIRWRRQRASRHDARRDRARRHRAVPGRRASCSAT